MHLIVAGLNHKTAPLDIREKCAFTKIQVRDIYRELKTSDSIDGAVLLVTCNRTEIYAAAKDIPEGFDVLIKLLQPHAESDRACFSQYIYQYAHHQTVAHLFAVTAGLDSMILGEQEILGQIRDAYQTAVDAQAEDSLLNMLFQAALHTGKKVRAETGINRYPVSVSSAAVELCREIFGTLDATQVLVVGAGDSGGLTVKHLIDNGVRSVIVSNRSYDHALEMALAVGGRAVHFDGIADELANADIVISCTAAPHPVIRSDNCGETLQARKGREIVMIDIAVPRDIAPELADIRGVFLYDIDDLQNVVEKNYKERLQAAHKARSIIEQDALKFTEKLASFPLVPVIQSLKHYAEGVTEAELAKALAKLTGMSEREQSVISSLAHGLVNKLLHAPIAKMKEKSINNQGHLYVDVIQDLFDLQIDEHNVQTKARNKRK
jgi:glutamyl-tRNA reductase